MDKNMVKSVSENIRITPAQEYDSLRDELNQSKKYVFERPVVIVGVGIAWFMFYFLWTLPPKHKNFSDRDRLEATSRAMGGSGAPPELPIPDMTEKKHHKHKKKK